MSYHPAYSKLPLLVAFGLVSWLLHSRPRVCVRQEDSKEQEHLGNYGRVKHMVCAGWSLGWNWDCPLRELYEELQALGAEPRECERYFVKIHIMRSSSFGSAGETSKKHFFFPLGILRACYYVLNFLEVDTVDKWKWDLELKHRDKKERVGPRDTQDDG